RDLLDSRRLRVPALRDHPERDVVVRDDPDQASVLDDRSDPRLLAFHQLRSVDDRVTGLHCARLDEHELPDLSHLESLPTEPMSETRIRRLGPGDEDVVRALAEDEAQTALLSDDRTVFVAAFDDETPVGFAFGYVLPRRHGRPTIFFVYEIDVDQRYQ